MLDIKSTIRKLNITAESLKEMEGHNASLNANCDSRTSFALLQFRKGTSTTSFNSFAIFKRIGTPMSTSLSSCRKSRVWLAFCPRLSCYLKCSGRYRSTATETSRCAERYKHLSDEVLYQLWGTCDTVLPNPRAASRVENPQSRDCITRPRPGLCRTYATFTESLRRTSSKAALS